MRPRFFTEIDAANTYGRTLTSWAARFAARFNSQTPAQSSESMLLIFARANRSWTA